MTTFLPQLVNCIICNTRNEVYLLTSTNSFCSLDLDFRPAGMARHNLEWEIQSCKKCGFSAPYISEDFLEMLSDNKVVQIQQLRKVKEYVLTKEYKNLVKDRSFPKLSNLYLSASQIQQLISNNNLAFHLTMKAAWVCDDKNKEESAKQIRRRALEHIEKTAPNFLDKITKVFLKIDLLRRTEQFKEAAELINLVQNVMPEIQDDQEKMKIIIIQKDLINIKDSSVHSIEE